MRIRGWCHQRDRKHTSNIRGGRVDIHRDQAIVERFNRILASRLFGNQYAVEMRLPIGQSPSEWVVWLPDVVSTWVIGKKPGEAIKEKAVYSKPATSCVRPVGVREKWIPSSTVFRYLYQPGELEGGRKRATDPIWSLKVYDIGKPITKPK